MKENPKAYITFFLSSVADNSQTFKLVNPFFARRARAWPGSLYTKSKDSKLASEN